MAAWIVGGLGALLSGWIGTQRFAFSVSDMMIWVGASNLAALFGVLLTLQLEKVTWLKAHLLVGTGRTWLFLAVVYFGGLLLAAPALLDGVVFKWLAFPLMMSTGLMINPFLGPIQDHLVRKAQRRQRLKTRLAAERP